MAPDRRPSVSRYAVIGAGQLAQFDKARAGNDDTGDSGFLGFDIRPRRGRSADPSTTVAADNGVATFLFELARHRLLVDPEYAVAISV